ncbi:MAG: hypothetical protein ABIO43_08285, partial [Sphingomicrobium sp.]
GEQVGEWRHHDEHLTMFLLRFRRRHRFGPEADALPLLRAADVTSFDSHDQLVFDPERVLDESLDALEFAPDPPSEDAGGNEPWPAGPDQS